MNKEIISIRQEIDVTDKKIRMIDKCESTLLFALDKLRKVKDDESKRCILAIILLLKYRMKQRIFFLCT